MSFDPSDSAILTVGLCKEFPLQSGWRSLFVRQVRTALSDINVDVKRGEVFGLLGPNGAGKTTLMKILATLVLPTSGAAYVNGLDVAKHSTEVRSLLGVVYGDERSFFWRLSVRENLRFYAALYGMTGRDALQRVDELIDMVGLSDARDLRMHSYSTGMKQRAAIARGLLGDPQIVFMDEPTRSLDPVGTYEIHRIVRERLLADGRRTVLLATNNMAEAEALCDRVALIYRGAVQMMGTIPELQDRFAGDRRYTLTVSRADPDCLAHLPLIPGVDDATAGSVDPDGRQRIEVLVQRRAAAVPEVVRWLVGSGADVWGCEEQTATLDDLFRWAVERTRAADAARRQEVHA